MIVNLCDNKKYDIEEKFSIFYIVIFKVKIQKINTKTVCNVWTKGFIWCIGSEENIFGSGGAPTLISR